MKRGSRFEVAGFRGTLKTRSPVLLRQFETLTLQHHNMQISLLPHEVTMSISSMQKYKSMCKSDKSLFEEKHNS